MNAIVSDAPRPSRPAPDTGKPKSRRKAIFAAVGAAFLGLYMLGVGWFANTLEADMARTLQGSPAVADVEHR